MKTNDLLLSPLTDDSWTEKFDQKTCLLWEFSFFWRPSHCWDHLGLVESSKQVHLWKTISRAQWPLSFSRFIINNLEIPRDEDEVNKWEIHECDVRAHDPDTMVTPPTPKPTHKGETLTRSPSTIDLCHEEDSVVRKWSLSRYCSGNCILETKT
jgi:hypothetical protein